jgi:ferritin
MVLDKKIEEALNRQVNNELDASYAYLAVACYFDNNGLPGFAKWFRGHAQEEHEHAMKIYDYIYRRDGKVELRGMKKPKADYASAEEAVLAGYEHEQVVTKQIHELFELCNNERDYGTQNMLHWFLAEQVEEEDLFRRVLDLVRATEGNKWFLMQLDERMERPEEGGDE